ncbi:MAG: bifunctional metallophosphatase/5'-nucleotidase [Alphaproteobacteria bacterium]
MRHLTSGIALAALMVGAAKAETTLTLLTTNDVDQFDALGGLSGVVASERSERENVLFLHAGDSYSPSILAGFDQGAHMVDLLNMIAPDFMVLGNHEFDFGPEAMVSNLANTSFPMLAGNVVTETGSPVPHTSATAMVDVDGFMIGIMGLTSESAEVKSSVAPYDVTDYMLAAENLSAELKDAGADLIIALVHLTQSEDFALVSTGLADIIVSGDDHFQLTYWNGDVVLTESGEQAETVVAIDLSMRIDDRDRFRWSPSFRVIDASAYEATADVAATIATLDASLSDELAEVIGVTATEMDTTRPVIRGREATFGNLLTDAMRDAMGTDIAITNGGGIRAKAVYAPGTELTAGDILSELPFGNKTMALALSGEQILAALENGFSQVEDGAGRFPHVSGMSVVVDLSAEPMSRVVSATVGNAPLDLVATYTVATNDYMAGGGDGYSVLKEGEVLIDANASVLMASQLIDYIKDAGTVAPKLEGRISQ